MATLAPARAAGRRRRLALLLGVVAAGIGAAILLPPIPQDEAYHVFADQRAFLGVPAFLNVISNGLFLVVGLRGLAWLRREPVAAAGPLRVGWERGAGAILFGGIALTAVGSAWYHAAPSDATLVWDRLPMTIAFMAFFALLLADRVGLGVARALLPGLLALGAGSVVYWALTERAGAGDLRAYGLVQFLPMALIPLLLALFPAAYTRGSDVLGVLAWYAAAKAAEILDRPIFALGTMVSGHTLKHLLAGVAAWWILRMLTRRRPCAGSGPEVVSAGQTGR